MMRRYSTSQIKTEPECVMTYGPFYNNGGGDVPQGPVYIHFYKAVKKENKK